MKRAENENIDDKSPVKSSIDFLFTTPRKSANGFKVKNVRRSSKPDFSDDVLLDLLDESRSAYEKRREKRKNYDGETPIITNDTNKGATKRLKRNSCVDSSGSPILMSINCQDATSPIIGSCMNDDMTFDDPRSPILSSCNYGGEEMLRCDIDGSICQEFKDEMVVTPFRYPTNDQIADRGRFANELVSTVQSSDKFRNFSTSRDSKKCHRNAVNVRIDSARKLGEIQSPFIDGRTLEHSNGSFLKGFSTGNGKQIHISDETLEKVKKIFKDEEIIGTCEELKRMSVKKVNVRSGLSSSATKETTNCERVVSSVKPIHSNGNSAFKTGLGKSINVSKASLMKARKLFVETEKRESTSGNTNLNCAFSTGLGKSIKISEDSLKKAKVLFEETEKVGNVENQIPSFGFTTGLGKSIKISEDSLTKARSLFEETEKVGKVVDGNDENEIPSFGFTTGLGKSIKISEDSLKKARSLFDQSDCLTRTFCPINSPVAEGIDVENGDGSRTEETKFAETETNLSAEIRESVAACLAMDNEFDEYVSAARFSDDGKEAGLKREVASERQNQKDGTKDKMSLKKCVAPQLGRLSQQKAKHGRGRLKLSKFVGGKLPKTHSENELMEFGVKSVVLSVSSSNAENFKFSAREFSGTEMGERVIIFNDAGFAGKEEIYEYFVSMPGVDPRLISEKWVFNHFRWIVWKLAAMEVAFPMEFGGSCLTLEQVVMQLKFRYDQEIDSCKRSALRKITERDDIPAKMLVLCISDIQWRKTNQPITSHDTQLTVEVTDGWYKIPLLVDKVVDHLIERGKLYVGQKIITHNAQLFGPSDPCHPLDASAELRLKLAMNSTRPAHWDSKLGFCYTHRFLPVSISSLNVDGGIISCIITVVARIYPVRYMECLGKSYVFRNAKMEEKAEKFHRQVRCKLREQLSDKVFQTIDLFDDENFDDSATPCDESTDREMYDMLKRKECLEECESLVTPNQANRLREYHAKLIDAQKEKFEKKVLQAIEEEKEAGRFPEDRVVIPFVRILLAGISEEDVKTKSTAMLTLWRPTEDVRSIREGQAMCFYWITTKNTIQTKHIVLSSTKLTKYKKISVESAMLIDGYSARKVYNFAELSNANETEVPYDEVDIVGLVISVQVRGSPALVHLIDDTERVIAIRFWAGSLLDEECIHVNNIISASNLEKRRSSNSGPIPLIDATDRSIFTQVPKQSHLLKAMVHFQTNVSDLDNLRKLGLQKVQFN